MKKQRKQRKRPKLRKMRRGYGIGDFLDHIHGLAQAARKVQKEEQIMLAFDSKGKLVN